MREVAAPLFRRWNRRREGNACAQPEALPTCKPEGARAVASKRQGATGFCAELVLNPGWPGLACGIQKKIVGIEDSIAQILIRLPVDKLRAALRAQVDDSAGKTTPLRRQVAGMDLELLNRVLDWNQNRQVDVGDVERLAVQILGALIAEGATYLIVAPSEGVDANRSSGRTSLWDDGRSEDNQIKDIASVQG